jgi:hypothetical protein
VQPEHAWLLGTIPTLNPSGTAPVHVRKLLNDMGVEIRKEVRRGKRGPSAELERVGDNYRITLWRDHRSPHPLSTRERFSVAHELGHILLIAKFALQATTKTEYFEYERWCNEFAASLLVPDQLIVGIASYSPRAVLEFVPKVSAQCKVSLEVAGRRVVDEHKGVALMVCRQTMNAGGTRVLEVQWVAGSLPERQLQRGSHVRLDEPLGRALLPQRDASSFGGFREFVVSGGMRGVRREYLRGSEPRCMAVIAVG